MSPAFGRPSPRTFERIEMTWQPTFKQLETIADMGNAGMPLAAVAKALGVCPDELRAWIGRLVATRVAAHEPTYIPPARVPVGAPSFKLRAERIFELEPMPAAETDGAALAI
jgi:hypothetical protein